MVKENNNFQVEIVTKGNILKESQMAGAFILGKILTNIRESFRKALGMAMEP